MPDFSTLAWPSFMGGGQEDVTTSACLSAWPAEEGNA